MTFKEALEDGEANTVEVQRGDLRMRLWETGKGGAHLELAHKGVRDEVVIPKLNRPQYADVLELASMALRTWSKKP